MVKLPPILIRVSGAPYKSIVNPHQRQPVKPPAGFTFFPQKGQKTSSFANNNINGQGVPTRNALAVLNPLTRS